MAEAEKRIFKNFSYSLMIQLIPIFTISSYLVYEINHHLFQKQMIVAKTVLKMKEVYGCNPENIIAGIAPSIGACCYEVGEDVAEHFFGISEGVTKKEDKYMLDLAYINKYQLLRCGLKEENIEMSDICTACEVDKYFSYRKEQGCSGRFMSMIGLK